MSARHPLLRWMLVSLLVCCGGLLSSAEELEARDAVAKKSSKSKVYALIVAHNGSVDQGVKPLRYADDDGARYYETFSQLADETRLLTVLDADSQRVFPELAARTAPPSREELSGAIRTLAAQIKADKRAGLEPEVYLVFTGHGNVDERGEGYLSLSDGKLTRSDLYREIIRPLDASYTHLIIDACHAYFMVQSRGGGGEEQGAATTWRDDRSATSHDEAVLSYLSEKKSKSRDQGIGSTVGVILSTSGTAEVHEWSKLRAGVFSHQLRSALLGGADVDHDGAITYLEIEAFLAAANASVTNPRARISVYAKPPSQDLNRPLVELEKYREATLLTLPREGSGRYYIEDARGLRYADMNKSAGEETSIVLLREPIEDRPYYLRREESEQATLLIEGTDRIDGGVLAFAQIGDQARSSVEESFRAELFSTPFGPGFYAGYLASRQRYEALMEERDVAASIARSSGGDRWAMGVDLSYLTSGSPAARLFDERAIQHSVAASISWRSPRGWAFGPQLGYGFSAASGDSRVHRIAFGVVGERRLVLSDRLALSPRLFLGEQALLVQDSTLCPSQGSCADPVGLRGEGALALEVLATPRMSVHLDLGASLDLFTRAGLSQNEETLYLTPFAGVGVRF